MAFLRAIDFVQHEVNAAPPRRCWIALLAVAPIHTSLAFRAAVRKDLPHVSLFFAHTRTKSGCQLLDRLVFFPLKQALRRRCGETVAGTILN